MKATIKITASILDGSTHEEERPINIQDPAALPTIPSQVLIQILQEGGFVKEVRGEEPELTLIPFTAVRKINIKVVDIQTIDLAGTGAVAPVAAEAEARKKQFEVLRGGKS
jgi:hypothetical protein